MACGISPSLLTATQSNRRAVVAQVMFALRMERREAPKSSIHGTRRKEYIARISEKRTSKPFPWMKLIAGSAIMHSSTSGNGYDVALRILNSRKAKRNKDTHQSSDTLLAVLFIQSSILWSARPFVPDKVAMVEQKQAGISILLSRRRQYTASWRSCDLFLHSFQSQRTGRARQSLCQNQKAMICPISK